MLRVQFSTHLDPENIKQLSATVAQKTFCLVNTKVYVLEWYLRKWRETFDYINYLNKTFLAVLQSVCIEI